MTDRTGEIQAMRLNFSTFTHLYTSSDFGQYLFASESKDGEKKREQN